MMAQRLSTIGIVIGLVTMMLAPAAAHALVVCAKQKSATVAKVRSGDRCRSNERTVPVDAQTLQGLTAQQLMNARVFPASGPGAPAGPSLLDDAGQFVGYLFMDGRVQVGLAAQTPVPRVVRPIATGLVAIHVVQTAPGQRTLLDESHLAYFHESADCTGERLIIPSVGEYGSPLFRIGWVSRGGGQVIYPGDPIDLHSLRSYSRPPRGGDPAASNDYENCGAHDPGEPTPFPMADGRCCVPMKYSELRSAGPLASEDMPVFLPPFHIAGF